eukprot:jgi/Psemu1/13260/gm1.13260_g
MERKNEGMNRKQNDRRNQSEPRGWCFDNVVVVDDDVDVDVVVDDVDVVDDDVDVLVVACMIVLILFSPPLVLFDDDDDDDDDDEIRDSRFEDDTIELLRFSEDNKKRDLIAAYYHSVVVCAGTQRGQRGKYAIRTMRSSPYWAINNPGTSFHAHFGQALSVNLRRLQQDYDDFVIVYGLSVTSPALGPPEPTQETHNWYPGMSWGLVPEEKPTIENSRKDTQENPGKMPKKNHENP